MSKNKNSTFSPENNNNNNLNNSIFIKQSEIPKTEHKLSYQTIIDSLPEPNYKTSQKSLKNNNTEWRWRFYLIDGKKIAEMSFITPNNNER